MCCPRGILPLARDSLRLAPPKAKSFALLGAARCRAVAPLLPKCTYRCVTLAAKSRSTLAFASLGQQQSQTVHRPNIIHTQTCNRRKLYHAHPFYLPFIQRSSLTRISFAWISQVSSQTHINHPSRTLRKKSRSAIVNRRLFFPRP